MCTPCSGNHVCGTCRRVDSYGRSAACAGPAACACRGMHDPLFGAPCGWYGRLPLAPALPTCRPLSPSPPHPCTHVHTYVRYTAELLPAAARGGGVHARAAAGAHGPQAGEHPHGGGVLCKVGCVVCVGGGGRARRGRGGGLGDRWQRTVRSCTDHSRGARRLRLGRSGAGRQACCQGFTAVVGSWRTARPVRLGRRSWHAGTRKCMHPCRIATRLPP